MSSRLWKFFTYAIRALVLAVLVVWLPVVGLLLYINDRDTRQQLRHMSSDTAGTGSMALYLLVTVQKIDPGSQTVVLSVLPEPGGPLGKATRNGVLLTQDVQLSSPYYSGVSVLLSKGTIPAVRRFSFLLGGGSVSEFPLDEYEATVVWRATTSDGTSVPITMDFTNADPFFVMKPTGYVPDPDAAGWQFAISRSRGTLLLAWFMMITMWAMALAVTTGAFVLMRKHEGLIWPALGWMAATLFALVGLRNSAPGSPPIGSLIDYVAFFWAEGIITASVVGTVVIGFLDDRKQIGAKSSSDRQDADASQPLGYL